MSMTNDPVKRKSIPLATGCTDYFADALIAVAELSRVGGEQHNPGQPLFWDKTKSTDHADAMLRHFLERGTIDIDGVRHSAKVAWRALAILQTEIEKVHLLRNHAVSALGELSTHPMAAEILRADDDLDSTGVCS